MTLQVEGIQCTLMIIFYQISDLTYIVFILQRREPIICRHIYTIYYKNLLILIEPEKFQHLQSAS